MANGKRQSARADSVRKPRAAAVGQNLTSPVARTQMSSWPEMSEALLQLAVQRSPRGNTQRAQTGDFDHLDGRRFIFRGTRRSDWLLQSKFQRVWRDLAPNQRARIHLDQVKAFRDECMRHGIDAEVYSSDMELEAFGQHNGLPTRLLDWSLNPLVASFFACSDALFNPADQATYLVVHALRVDSPVWSNQQEAIEIVSVNRKNNERALRQQGVFTYDRSRSEDIEAYLLTCVDADVFDDIEQHGPVLTHFELPRSEASTAIDQMDLYGISFTSLFPDGTGLAQSAQLKAILSTMKRSK